MDIGFHWALYSGLIEALILTLHLKWIRKFSLSFDPKAFLWPGPEGGLSEPLPADEGQFPTKDNGFSRDTLTLRVQVPNYKVSTQNHNYDS